MNIYFLTAFFVLICNSLLSNADIAKDNAEKNDTEAEEPLKVGNFALPVSQQPGPLLGFGQNIIGKGQVQLYLFADDYNRTKGYQIDVLPSLLWGVTDQFSIYFNLAFSPGYKDRNQRSAGWEDCFIQLEYAFYNKQTFCCTEQATIVTSISFPTGSSTKIPPTGFGAPSYFLGATFNHMEYEWFYFGSLGSTLTSSTSHCTTFGNQFLYQGGFGRNISSSCHWIYAWMIEIDGYYLGKNRIKGQIDNNSGGNLILVTPSLWISSEHFIFQFGIGGPIWQYLFGRQSPYTFQIVTNFGWTF